MSNNNMSPQTPSEIYLHEQVNRIDREMAALATSQTSLIHTVEAMAESVSTLSREMRDGFNSIASEKAQASKTNWQTIASVSSIFILIVAGLYGLVSSNASDGRQANTNSINELKTMMYEHVKGGHPQSVINKISALEKSHDKEINRIDQKAERALSDIQARSGKRFNREDHDKYAVPRFETLEKFVAENREVDATQNARLDFLEKDTIKDIKNQIGDRFTMGDYEREVKPELVKLISEKNGLQAQVKALEILVEKISQEQLRRANWVYQDSK